MVEKIKEKSVLKEEELAYLSEIGFLDAADEEFFSEQKNLFFNEQVSKVWDAWYKRNWLGVLEAILKIPADIDSDIDLRLLTTLDMVNLGRTSLLLLFWNIRRHFTIEEVRTVSQFSRRAGQDLNKEPWKEMFLEMARKYFPDAEDGIEKMIEAVAETRIDKDEYIQVIWEHMIEITKENQGLVEYLEGNSDFVEIVAYMDKYMHGQQMHARELLQAGDTLLSRKSFRAACNVYKTLIEEGHDVWIGEAREKIIEIRDGYDRNKFSYEKMVRKVKRVIKKAGLAIEIK
jgi:hypothetical protein